MNIYIISIFPDMFKSVFEYGVVGKSIKLNNANIEILDLRDFANNKYSQVDDRPYGGGAGMILMPEPLANCIESVKSRIPETELKFTKTIYLSPKGRLLSQSIAEELSALKNIILVCGRYEGIDQRIIDSYIDLELSIGNYVLSGGELPAMVVVDSLVRLIPGTIKNKDFNIDESFSDPLNRKLLDFPQYTRPEVFNGLKVPDVLLSGNHKEILLWRKRHKSISKD